MSLLQKPYLPTELILKILAYLPYEDANDPEIVKGLHSIYDTNKNYIIYNILRTNNFACDFNIAPAMYKQLKLYKYNLTKNYSKDNKEEYYITAARNNHVELFTLIIQNSLFIVNYEFLWSSIEAAGSNDHVEIIKLLLTHPRIITQLGKISNEDLDHFKSTSRIFGTYKITAYLLDFKI